MGLVCRTCKEKLHPLRSTATVAYCFTCGKSYQPLTTSVKHLNCQTEVEDYDRKSGAKYGD